MSQLLASYVVQAAAALFTAVLFGFFSRTYRKPFLLHWARGFSALCIMSLVMRKGVGDGRGEGTGVGVGV